MQKMYTVGGGEDKMKSEERDRGGNLMRSD